uniref:Uncharacterized protein n=1 Tax=Arundo donax TaxID=35708 RepID=A0A0A9AXL2_ARUDO
MFVGHLFSRNQSKFASLRQTNNENMELRLLLMGSWHF